jgi:DNA-binding transcriptional MerR regulator
MERVIDVNFEEMETKSFFTLEEVSAQLKLDAGTVVFYCNKFEEILKITSIGQFQIFNKEDLRNLETIRELNLDKNMSVSEIKQFLNQNSTAIIVKKDRVEALDYPLLQFLGSMVEAQNQKIDKLMEAQNKSLKVFAQLYNEICIDSENKNKMLNKIRDEQQEQRKASIGLESQINDLKKDMDLKYEQQKEETKAHVDKLVNDLKTRMEQHKIQSEIKVEKKSWLSRIFK